MSLGASAGLSTKAATSSASELLAPSRDKVLIAVLVALWVLLALTPLYFGLPYYLEPLGERPYDTLHETFKPSGLIGQGLGILGTLMVAFGVSSYMIRKRWSRLAKWGKLKNWLRFHIFLCTLGPFFILLHTTFKFGNIASVSFWSMAVVVASGVFGRYVYVRIPKTVNGQFLSPAVIQQAQATLIERIAHRTELPADQIQKIAYTRPETQGVGAALIQSLAFEFRKGHLKRQFNDAFSTSGIDGGLRRWSAAMLLEHARLQMRAQVLQPFVRAFGYWHVLHIPLALVMLVALIVHVGVAIAFGYTWIF